MARHDISFGLEATPAFIAMATRCRFAAGADIFLEGHHADDLIGIAAGRVKLWRTLHDGDSCTILALGPGELIGSVAVAQGTTHVTSASAMTDVEALCWPASTVRDMLKRSDTLPRAFLGLVARRVSQLVDRMEDTFQLPVDKRLARALVRLVGDGEHDDDLAVRLDVRQQDLAEMALTTVPTVSRTLSAWRAAGIITTERTAITIPHLSRLALVANMHID